MVTALRSSVLDHQTELENICDDILGGKRLIMASNRGPVEYRLNSKSLFDGHNSFEANRGNGGVVTALTSLARYCPITWISSPLSEGDRRIAEQAGFGHLPSPISQQDLLQQFVAIQPDAFQRYLNEFSNPYLWFLQHKMWDQLQRPPCSEEVYKAWGKGYEVANKAYAETILCGLRNLQNAPVVSIHDYHLYRVAPFVRKLRPKVVLQHFVHIPWPEPDYWEAMPNLIVKRICEGLCSNDIVGFQTELSVWNFLRTCGRLLEDADIDYELGLVYRHGNQTQVRAYPISIDVKALRQTTASLQVKQYLDQLMALSGRWNIVRVDRLDPSKNILGGFQAYRVLLDKHPELVGQVKFLAFLVPSRTEVAEYQAYTQEIMDLVKAINSEYGWDGWKPIEVFYENNYHQALAGMALYDVLLVNSLADGMNLVAKEGPIVNQRDGVLVLSEEAGATEQLRDGALVVSPFDIQGTAEALYEALTLSLPQRRMMISRLRRAIEEQDLTHWLIQQLKDIRQVVSSRNSRYRLWI